MHPASSLARIANLLLLLPIVSQVASAAPPLKIFLLAGQSNMEGHAHVRTIEHLAMQEESRPLMEAMVQPDRTPKTHPLIWISSLNSQGIQSGPLTIGYGATKEKIGPELTFGYFLQQRLGEPILLIKTAWGGRSLHTDFRPPSAGPYQFSETEKERLRREGKDLGEVERQKQEATGVAYRAMVAHVQAVLDRIDKEVPFYDRQGGYELAGVAWLQGWNDMVDGTVYPERGQPGGYDEYSKLLAQWIRDVRRDLGVPNLPVVIGVMGVGGPTALYDAEQKRYAAIHQTFRDAMAAPASLPEFQGRVIALRTEAYWDLELSGVVQRDAKLVQESKRVAKERQWDDKARQAWIDAQRGETFSERERELLRKGVSNAEFHYLGSARILGGIGHGMADAMAELISQ
jgi:alpha-galactosidase